VAVELDVGEFGHALVNSMRRELGWLAAVLGSSRSAAVLREI
jgi:hypothetical protein